MAYRKLNLDWDKINRCRHTSTRIVKNVQKYVDRHSSLSIESACLCLLGIERFGERRHIANQIITKIERDQIRRGALYWFGRALLNSNLKPHELAIKIAHGEISLKNVPDIPFDKIKQKIGELANIGIKALCDASSKRQEFLKSFETARQPAPLFFAKIEHDRDIKHFVSGPLPHIVLLKNLRVAPSSIDRNSGRWISPLEQLRKGAHHFKKFAFPISGLETPKHAWEAVTCGIDIISCDPFKDIFSLSINPKRAFVDSHWVKRICALTKTTLYSDMEHVTELDPYRESHQILVAQFIMEQFAESARIRPDLLAVGHTFDIDPTMEDGFLSQLARAAIVRELYTKNLSVYSPSKFAIHQPAERAKFTTLFKLSGMITEQSALFLPPSHDYHDAIKAADLITNQVRTLGDEIQFNPNGKIARRAHIILENTLKTLGKIEQAGLLESLSKGLFGGLKAPEKNTGLDGVFQKERDYFNPVEEMLNGAPEECYCVQDADVTITRREASAPKRQENCRPQRHKRFKRRPVKHAKSSSSDVLKGEMKDQQDK